MKVALCAGLTGWIDVCLVKLQKEIFAGVCTSKLCCLTTSKLQQIVAGQLGYVTRLVNIGCAVSYLALC